jgi:hypothetical protein
MTWTTRWIAAAAPTAAMIDAAGIRMAAQAPRTVARAAANPRRALEARVAGTAKNGGPNCATVKPFSGWVLKA